MSHDTDPATPTQWRPMRMVAALMAAASLVLAACAGPAPRPAPPRPQPAQSTPAPTTPVPMPAYVEQWLRQGSPEQVALLLPLSGPFAATAAAVRDGFMAEHFASRTAKSVRIYDVGDSQEQMRVAYQRALDDGSGFLVGPLKKESVA